jgi:uracil phosphoribosyltransferase
MKKIFISKHPLVLDKISRLRNKNTCVKDFRRIMAELSMVMGYEVLLNARLKYAKVQTPLGHSKTLRLAQDIVFVAILRAGLGMIDGLVKIHPEATLAHIGIYRDEETLKPIKYYVRLPKSLENSFVILADPMLATGGSAVKAADILKLNRAKNINFMCLIAAKQGIERLSKAYPEIPIYVGAVDEHLNDKGYIIPGLGDAGDRMFGTH